MTSLQCLSTPTRLLGTSPWATGNLFRPWHWLAENAFILGPPSWAIMIKTNLYLLTQSFLIKISPPWTTPRTRIGPQAWKQTSDELLGPISLQYTTLHLLQQPKSFRWVIEIYIFDKNVIQFCWFQWPRKCLDCYIHLCNVYFFFFGWFFIYL